MTKRIYATPRYYVKRLTTKGSGSCGHKHGTPDAARACAVVWIRSVCKVDHSGVARTWVPDRMGYSVEVFPEGIE